MAAQALPNEAVGFEILTIVYEQILAHAGIAAGAPPPAYQQLLTECDSTFAINNSKRIEIAFQRYFGLRANPAGTIGGAFAARHPWPGGPPAVQAYIGTLSPIEGTPTLSFDRTQTHYVLAINDRANEEPDLHITIPRNPIGLGIGDATNYTMHFTNKATGQHIYHPFADPRGLIAAAAAQAAAAAPPLALAGAPVAQGWRAREAAKAAAAPVQETGMQRMLRLAAEGRRGGRRKTKRSKRGRRTRRR
jgi:hypothetical protein